MCGTLHSMFPYAPPQRKLVGHTASMKASTVQPYILLRPKDLCRPLMLPADAAVRSCRAPGNTHACKNPFFEEIPLPVGSKTDLAFLGNSLQRELADLFG